MLCAPLDSWHIALRKPQQFDRSVANDGKRNMYQIEKGGRKIWLFPMKEECNEDNNKVMSYSMK